MAVPITSSTEIANLALSMLGVQNITNLDDPDTPEALKVAQFYAHSLDTVLEETFWNFAQERATLSQSADEVDFAEDPEYDYAYLLPSDYIKLAKLNGYPISKPGNRFRIERGYILTDADTAKIVYTYRNESPEDYPQQFVKALASRVAADCCRALNGSEELRVRMEQQYLHDVNKAKFKDASENQWQKRGIPGAIADSALVQRRKNSSLG